jgi:predicted DNA repair protein MutK
MASGFFSILDDLAALMDDVAVASKVATRKTAGILGDDLAVNAEKATGFLASRELPVLWAITKGSFINKLIIVPIVLLLSAFFPTAIIVSLVLGGFYLAYEGVEKIIEYLFHRSKAGHEVIEERDESNSPSEKAKVKSAITTDFILSVEIVIIALGAVLDKSLTMQIIIVCIVAVLATVGVYGLVALIVRMDDIGYKLIKHSSDKGIISKLGHVLVKSLPIIIKFIGFIGTIALILVSGGIFVHNIDYLHHFFPEMPTTIKEFVMGLAAGLIVVAVVSGGKKIFSLLKRD